MSWRAGEPGPVAADYERLMLASPGMVKSPAGLPVFDLVLLGTGEDGHVGSLHPKSDEVKATGQVTAPSAQPGLSVGIRCLRMQAVAREAAL